MFNKWIVGSIAFLIVFSIACVFWSRYQIAPYKQDAAKTDEIRSEWETTRKANTDSQQVDPVPNETIDSMTPEITDETIVEPVDEFSEAIPSISFDKPAEVRYSPHGLGPYPEVPKEYFLQKGPTTWQMIDLLGNPPPSLDAELISRVLLKLWKEGDTMWRSAGLENGKVYVFYPNQGHVRYSLLKFKWENTEESRWNT